MTTHSYKAAEQADKIRCHPVLPNTASGRKTVRCPPCYMLICNFGNRYRGNSAVGNGIEFIAGNEAD